MHAARPAGCHAPPLAAPGPSSQRAASLVAHARRVRGRNGSGSAASSTNIRRRDRGVEPGTPPAQPAEPRAPSPSALARDGQLRGGPAAYVTRTQDEDDDGEQSGCGSESGVAAPATPTRRRGDDPRRGSSADDVADDGRQEGRHVGLPHPPGGRLPRPGKADLFLYRTDGLSCTRELVKPGGTLTLAHPSTQQQLLVWRTRPRAVMVLKKLGPDTDDDFTAVVAYLATEERLLVIVEPHELEPLLARRPDLASGVDTYTAAEAPALADTVDFVVCLGGDGLVLHASSLFQRAIPPVISFNLGSLGFLTNHSIADFRRDLADVIAGREPLGACAPAPSTSTASTASLDGGAGRAGVHITLRMRLECQVVRAGTPEPETFEVLNEVVLDRGSSPYLTKLECWERGRLVTKVQADGVMLATTTGSTAYSVAAGGSMVHPNVPAILFTPICPHSLSFRPVVLPDYAELEVRVAGDMRSTAFVCFDGKARQELGRGDAVRVRMSTHPVPTISKADSTNDWFDTLNRCFGWNERLEQKPR